jgi:hypothetical protein
MMLILIMCPWAIGKGLDNSRIVSKKGINMMIISTIEVITGTVIIMLSLVKIWVQLS